MAAGADCLLAGFMQRRRLPKVTYPYSCPEISELQFSTTDQTPAADSLLFFCEDSRSADSFVYAGSEIDDR